MLNRLSLGFALCSLILTSCLATSPSEAPARYELFVLGVAQDGGLPHLGCNKSCCTVARATGRVETPACLGIHDRETGALALIEATPAVESQVAQLHELSGAQGRGRAPVDAIMLTHAHIGHYVGLAQFGREVASTKDLAVHVSPRMAEFLRTNGPWKQLVELKQLALHEITLSERFEVLPGLFATATRVPHRDEFSDTLAFTIHGPNRSVLFVPDIDSWSKTPGLLDALIDGVDVAYLDATFYDGRELPGRNLADIPHPPMIETMKLLATDALAAPGRFRFIHLNHSNPVWHDGHLQTQLEARGFRVAESGERVGL